MSHGKNLRSKKMNNTRRDDDLIRIIIEKHFDNMVDEVLEHTETYSKALGAISYIKGSNIPSIHYLSDCLKQSIRQRAMQQKTPNHQRN